MVLQQPGHPLHRRASLPPRDGEGVERVIVEDATEPPLQKFRSVGGLVGRGQEGVAVPLQLAPDGGGGGRVAEVGLRERPGDRGEPVLEADLGAAVVAHCSDAYPSELLLKWGGRVKLSMLFGNSAHLKRSECVTCMLLFGNRIVEEKAIVTCDIFDEKIERLR